MYDKNTVPSAFSSTAFKLYFSATAFLTLSTWITRFLIGWSTWEQTQSAFWVGVASALMLVPTLFLSPIFGVVADRVDPRLGMLLAHFGEALIALGGALASFGGVFSLGWILALALALGLVSAVQHPMRLAVLPRLVERGLFPSAIGLASTTYNAARVLGPALGAWLLTAVATDGTFLVASALSATGALFLLRLRLLRTAASLPHSGSILMALSEGVGVILQSPLIKLVLALTMVDGLLGRSIMELLPAISGELIGGDAGTLATLTALAGVGSILGGIVVSRRRSRERTLLRLIRVALLCSATVLLCVLAVRELWQLGGLVMALSTMVTIIGTGCQALIQLSIGDAYRGRVLSIWTVVSLGMPALGAFLLGAAADAAGFPVVLTAAAVVGALGVLMLSRRYRIVKSPVIAESGADDGL